MIETADRLTPVEVKWTDAPTAADTRPLTSFLAEYPQRAPRGYLICRCERPMQLADAILALPWWML